MAMADQSDNLKACPAKPRVVVGLDFGTTYSGFAFAHISNPEKVYTYYDYPRAGGEKPYCKTLTASYYKALPPAPGSKKGRWQLHSWGYPARTDHERDIQALHKYMQSQNPASNTPSEKKPTSSSSSSSHAVENYFSRSEKFSSRNTTNNAPSIGVFLSRFKLHLASRKTEASSASPLPTGLTIEQVITDYLRELGGLILQHLQKKYGAHFSKELIQWCITVPSIWDNSAKATMRACMVAADLMGPHPIVIVLEPEAASFHSQRLMGEVTLEVGNKLVVADIGGGTSDIVAQEVVSVGKHGYKVKEVTMSSGGLCGGTYVDSRFIEFLEGKIGRCFPECILKYRNVYGQLMKEWECTKSYFDCGQGTTTVNLPNKLAMEWERSNPGSQEYGEVEISFNEMQSIFDPIVQENLDLIQQQLVEVGSKVRFLVLVGGFTESPYLLHRIKQTFGAMVESIICPPNPGSAICQGAVALALNPGAVVSRICKRTYGYDVHGRFEKEIDPLEYLRVIDGEIRCANHFQVLVKKGDVVKIDKPKITRCFLVKKAEKTVAISLCSCDDRVPPRYTTDKGMKEEGELKMDISKDMELDNLRSIEVSLVFGGSSLEVKARAVNFKAEPVKLPVQVDYLLI